MEFLFAWFAIGLSNYFVYEMKRFTIKNLNREVKLYEVEEYFGRSFVIVAAVSITLLYFVIIVPLWPWSVCRRIK